MARKAQTVCLIGMGSAHTSTSLNGWAGFAAMYTHLKSDSYANSNAMVDSTESPMTVQPV